MITAAPAPNELAVANLVNSLDPDFCVPTGDNSYGSTDIDINIGQYYSDFIGNYQGTYGSGAPSTGSSRPWATTTTPTAAV